MEFTLDAEIVLPEDGCAGALVGRAWVPDANGGGPSVVAIAEHGVYDISQAFPTSADLMNAADPAFAIANTGAAIRLGGVDAILANTVPDARDPTRPWFLAPIDLQCIKAAGVTFM